MISFSKQLSKSLKRIDCKFFNPKEKFIQISSTDKFIFENIGKYVDINGGKRLSKDALIDKTGEIYSIPYIRGEDINDEIVSFENAVKISNEEHLNIINYSLANGDVCITNVGTIGSAGFVNKDCENNFSENMARLRVKDLNKLLPEYLFYFCLSEYAKLQFDRFYVGSLQYKLSLDSIRNECKIIIPTTEGKIDLKKQHILVNSIKNILNNQFILRKQIQKQIKHTNSIVEETLNIADYTRLKKKIFVTEINDNTKRFDALYNNPGYDLLKNYLESIETISLKDCLCPNTIKEKAYKDFYDVVDLANIDDDIGEIKSTKTIAELDSDKIILNANNIIISKLQTDKIKVAIVSPDYDLSSASSELLQFEVKSGYEKKYILYAIRTQIVKQQWDYSLTGSSRMRINEDIILNTKIPYPTDENIRKQIVLSIDQSIAQIKNEMKNIKDINTIVTNMFKEFFGI